eukprot:TRINITY_DN5986_c0_g1_i1.p1 TRINITY_DN5986_c0_g1~~TRINITY_DN5986_c0_g1_i1.p1  ORF type:complete len:638 (+),score=94.87 TRINITY_DN5986_c0_g1_i1:51-1964(+)
MNLHKVVSACVRATLQPLYLKHITSLASHPVVIRSLLIKGNAVITSHSRGCVHSFKRSFSTDNRTSENKPPSETIEPLDVEFRDKVQELCEMKDFSAALKLFQQKITVENAFELLVCLNTSTAPKPELCDVGMSVYSTLLNKHIIPSRQVYYLFICLFNKFRPEKSIDIYHDMLKLDVGIDDRCFSELTMATFAKKDLSLTRKLMELVNKQKIEPTAFALGNLLGTLEACGSPKEAVTIWRFIEKNNVPLNRALFLRLFSLFAEGKYIQEGENLVLTLTSRYPDQLKTDKDIESAIIYMNIKCGKLEKALTQLEKRQSSHVLKLWEELMDAYTQQKDFFSAIKTFDKLNRMKNDHPSLTPTALTYTLALKACASSGLVIQKVRQIEEIVQKRRINDPQLNGALIYAYSRNNDNQRALEIFMKLDQVEPIVSVKTFTEGLVACGNLGPTALETGKKIHALIQQRNTPIDTKMYNQLIEMYTRCGEPQTALKIFESQKNVLTPNEFTYMCAFDACSAIGPTALETGKKIHKEAADSKEGIGIKSLRAIVQMYQMCGDNKKCIETFHEFERRGLKPPMQAFVSCLATAPTFGKEEGLKVVKEIDAAITKWGFVRGFVLMEKLNQAYSLCGHDRSIDSKTA